MPTTEVVRHTFPKSEAFIDAPDRPYKILGVVRTQVSWPTTDPAHEEDALCKNYYNKGVKDLLRRAKDNGGSGVAEVRSVVFLINGKSEIHKTAECSDDGTEGQILMQGVAIKYKSESEWTNEEREKFAKKAPKN